MHPLLVERIQEKKEKLQKEKDEIKAVHLTRLGLCEKVYSPVKGKDGYNYEGQIFNSFDVEKDQFYKLQPIEISDEDYEELLKYFPKEEDDIPVGSGIASVITVIGVLTMICGLIGGFYLLTDVSGALGLISIIYSFVSGFLFLGFAEIIKMLKQIKDK